ncbi:MAG: Ig-like domain-containing protein [Bacteroidaceae bacterium]|nr:Ig-like domain-containing protein [Bacteroidaceae bacterium]
MKLRDFLKLMVMVMVLPLAFVACSENDEPEIPESVTLNEADVDMLMGGTLQLTATVVSNDPNSTAVTWTSSNPAVATVDNNGLITAVAPGEAVITATLGMGRAQATCEVEVDAENMLLVFNGGSMYSSIDGSLSAVKFERSQTVSNNVFSTANGRSLGATVQDGVVYGDNLYIAVDGSNTIEVVNKYSFKSVTTILPDQTAYEPRDIVADDNYIYVSMYTGYVARIDPKTNKIDKTVQVGPNPEEMVVEDGFLYVVNSDGLNYNYNYVNGKTVSKIDLKSFTEVKKIEVGLNPTAIVETEDKFFVLCMGNYGMDPNYEFVPTSIYVIDENDNVTNTNLSASFFAAEDGVLYVVDSPWGGSTSYVSYSAKDLSVISDQFVKDPVDAPAGIAVEDDRIFISSYNLVNGSASYNTDGYVNEYRTDATAVYPPNYQLVKKYDVGVGPVHMLVVD